MKNIWYNHKLERFMFCGSLIFDGAYCLDLFQIRYFLGMFFMINFYLFIL